MQFERTFNLDIARRLDIGLFHSPLNAAFGFEHHMEEFEQKVGEAQSWFIDANLRHQGFSIGSNGFAGYRPDSAGVFERNNYALYMDLEAAVVPSLNLGLSGRYENFDSAIGESLNGKLALRWTPPIPPPVRGEMGGVGPARFGRLGLPRPDAGPGQHP